MQAFENQLDKIPLQKLLFLFTAQQEKTSYDFVPYLYGCYSFSAAADLKAMVRNGDISEHPEHYARLGKANYIASLTDSDKKILSGIKSQFRSMSSRRIMKHTYLHYTYYAINSVVAKKILTQEEYSNVSKSRPAGDRVILYTIGYEGISLEKYLNKLIQNDIKVLVDVRSNPLSMKFGFSKNQLRVFCENVNIQYLHIPEVGIHSAQRQALNSQLDYDVLFSSYRKNNLTKTVAQQSKILELLKEKKRIALTCFESNICQCHRKDLAEAITRLDGWSYQIAHI